MNIFSRKTVARYLAPYFMLQRVTLSYCLTQIGSKYIKAGQSVKRERFEQNITFKSTKIIQPSLTMSQCISGGHCPNVGERLLLETKHRFLGIWRHQCIK